MSGRKKSPFSTSAIHFPTKWWLKWKINVPGTSNFILRWWIVFDWLGEMNAYIKIVTLLDLWSDVATWNSQIMWSTLGKMPWLYWRSGSIITLTHWASLQWRLNGRYDDSNHQPHDCLLNLLFKRRYQKTSKLDSHHWPLRGEFTSHRWIPRAKDQWRGKCFHLVTSSWH